MHHFVECQICVAGAPTPDVLDAVEAALEGPGVSVQRRSQAAAERWTFTVFGPGDGIRRSALRAFRRCREILGEDAAAVHEVTIRPFGETPLAECVELTDRISAEVAEKSLGKITADAQPPTERLDERARERARAAAFETRLSSAFPVPGGGAAAARTARLAACLVLKVIAISLRSKSSANSVELRDDLRAHEAATAETAARFLQLEEDDQRAFLGLLDAYRLPRGDSAAARARNEAVSGAALEAIRTPIDTLEGCLRLLETIRVLVDRAREGAIRAESDLGAAAELALAAFRSAEWNVAVNLASLEEGERSRVVTQRDGLRTSFEAAYQNVRTKLVKIIGDAASPSR